MKRIILLLALMLPCAALADNVSVQQAQSAAESFFASGKTKAGNLTLVWDGRDLSSSISNQSVQDPAFYVFGRAGGGFVIISGDDALKPVIAYSYDNNFITENMPDNVSYWFERVRGAVQYVRKNIIGQTPQVAKSWDELMNGTRSQASTIVKYTTAQWGQGEPYNNDCPEVGGVKTVTGCVATATAILMRYFEYPKQGHGTLPAYTTRTEKISIPAVVLGNTYDWEEMPLVYTGWTSSQQKEVARLLYHCGVMVKMDYCVGGSAAWIYEIPRLMVEYFDYDASGLYVEASSESPKDWVAKIKQNLVNVGPTFCSGYDPANGGHAFIFDGYDSEDFVSVNWGWYGYYNGFYSIVDLNPDKYRFNQDQEVLLSIKPDQGSIAQPRLIAGEYSSCTGLSISSQTLTPGEKFDASFTGSISNVGFADFNGKLAIGLESQSGSFKEIVSSEKAFSVKSYYRSWLLPGENSKWKNCTISNKAVTGDKLKLYQKADGDNSWTAVSHYNEESMTYEIAITVKSAEPKIETVTVSSFDKSTGILTFHTLSDASARLTDSAGNEVTTGVSVRDGIIEIDKNKLEAGTYSLTISKKEDSKTVTLKF